MTNETSRTFTITVLLRFFLLVCALSVTACGSSSDDIIDETAASLSDDSSDDSSDDDSDDDDSDSDDDTSADESDDDSSTEDTSCEESGEMAELVCSANAFMDTLSADQQAGLVYEFTDSTAKTTWSNLPSVSRNGLAMGDLTSSQQEAAFEVLQVALTEQGMQDLEGLLAADDYLVEIGAGSNQYGSDHYYLAFIGEPSTTENWMLQFGGHHMAFNITYMAGVGYPVPMHEGAEPKGSFEINSTTYAPLADEGNALVAMFNSLTADELSNAFLYDEYYSDVLVGPDNGNGTYPSSYPYGSNRTGVLVSELTEEQQAYVIAAIETWVNDYPANVAEHLLADYTSEAALEDTYIAWAGDESTGVDVDVSGTYMRIDGPRLWIEVVCQNGIIVRNQTHYHTVFRDKTYDYGNSL